MSAETDGMGPAPEKHDRIEGLPRGLIIAAVVYLFRHQLAALVEFIIPPLRGKLIPAVKEFDAMTDRLQAPGHPATTGPVVPEYAPGEEPPHRRSTP